ncbi:DUF1292 domain-containing protein [[Clostridium] polysaccharolyticum]|jgi:uncharacterized protein YrzB (UPF0473 family)|uniref:UPF0473 protein SAMN04487772_10747 n=1 Tax=[Clostridium] polysaccharolyticum TaxID=29364 RepID=A0A1I0BAN1_9FIRM|nr:DUF1292 domain-containing protein [[Clostridium] polysaccharolyticum]SET03851.1 Protein of unknown function [[Clostridium] polysaccharolyticum]
MAEDRNLEESRDIITLTLEDDSEVECVVLSIFPVEEKEYIALMPAEELEKEEENSEVLLYRFSEPAEGEVELDNIETDEEYEIVAEAFSQILDEMEADTEFEDFEAGE